MPAQTYSVDELARAAWPLAVGKKVAARTYALKVVRTNLVIEVEDEVWRSNLMSLSGQILSNIARHIGAKQVESLEFRVVPPRRGPQKAETSIGPASGHADRMDEAERIDDPGLRRVYRAERARAIKASA